MEFSSTNKACIHMTLALLRGRSQVQFLSWTPVYLKQIINLTNRQEIRNIPFRHTFNANCTHICSQTHPFSTGTGEPLLSNDQQRKRRRFFSNLYLPMVVILFSCPSGIRDRSTSRWVRNSNQSRKRLKWLEFIMISHHRCWKQ